nr:hypothetical protein [Clostridia bacterium]
MRRPESPCRGCENRTPEDPENNTHDCHPQCAAYRKYVYDNTRYKKWLTEKKSSKALVSEYISDHRRRVLKGRK